MNGRLWAAWGSEKEGRYRTSADFLARPLCILILMIARIHVSLGLLYI